MREGKTERGASSPANPAAVAGRWHRERGKEEEFGDRERKADG